MLSNLLQVQLRELNIADSDVPPDPETWKRLLALISDTYSGIEWQPQYRALFDQTTDAVLIFDLESRIVEANQHLCDLTGYSRDELLQMRLRDIIAPGEESDSHEVWKSITSGKNVPPFERIVKRKDGTSVTIESSAQLVKDAQGKPLYVQAVLRDISQRKQNERALRQSETYYRLLINHIPHVVVIMFDHDMRYVLAEGQFLEKHGYSREAMVGKTMWEVLPEERLALYLPSHKAVLEGKESHFEVEVEGSVYASHFIPVQNEQGVILAGMIVIEDITQHRQGEAAVRLQSAMVDQTSDAVISTDLQLNVVTWNKAAEHIYGWTAEEAIGRYLGDAVGVNMPPERRDQAIRMLQSVGNLDSELTHITKSGALIHVLASTSLLRNGIGEASGFITVVHDISERKAMEEALRMAEARARAFLDAIPDMIIRHDREGRYVEIIPAPTFPPIRPVQEQIGKTVFDIMPHNLAEMTVQSIDRVLRTGQVEILEYQLEGEGKTYHREARMVQSGTDEVLVIVRDITERREAEAAIRFQATLVDHMDDAVYSTDLNEKIITWNRGAERLYGWSAEEAIGQFSGKMVGSQLTTEQRTKAVQQIREKGHWQGEIIHTHRDGTLIDTWVSTTLLTDANGKGSGFIAISRNITERKQAEAALRVSEDRFRRLINELRVGVLLQGPNAEMLLSNQAALDLLGITLDHLLGKTSFDPDWNVIHEDGSPFPGPTHPVPQAIATRQSVHDVVMGVYRPATQDRVWLLVNAEPEIGLDGEVVQVICTFMDITARKQAEEAVHYRATLVNQINDAVYSTDLQENIITWNRSAERMYGWSAEEAIGQKVPKILGAIVPPEHRKGIIDHLFNNGQWQGELLHTSRAGVPLNVLVSLALLRDEEGQYAGLIAVNHDITEQKRQQEALRLREEQYRELYTSTERQARELMLLHEVRTVMAREMELDTLIPAIVQSISTIFGYTHVSLYLLDNDLFRLQYQVGYDQVIDEVPITTGVLGRVVRTGKPIFVEDVTKDPDFLGAVPDLTAEIAVPLFDRGQVIGAFNIETSGEPELTDSDMRLMIALGEQLSVAIQRARLYGSLRDSQIRLRLIGESISDMIFQTDVDGVIEYISPSVYNLLGYRAETWMNQRPKQYLKYIHPTDVKTMIASFEGDGLINRTLRQEYRVQHIDGHYVDMEAISTPLIDRDGRVTGRLAIVRDVTERKMAEHHASELAAQVKLVDSLRRFLSNVSHDLRTPLSIMSTNVYLLRRKLGDILLYTRYLDVLDKQVVHLAQMVDNLMEVSRLEDQMVEFEFIPVRLGELARDVLVGQQSAVQEKGHTLHLAVETDIPVIQADQAWMGRVVRDLVGNAIQYTPDGGQITVRVRPEQDGVLLEVMDTGVGIAPEHVAHIFDRFYRADESRPSDKGGAGLGLTIVRKVVEAHQGWVNVESTLGQGSVFRVWLPAVRGERNSSEYRVPSSE